VVILPQSAERVRRYIEETGLPFDILIDQSRSVSKAYGVWHRIGLDAWNIARPAVFLIDPDGSVRYTFVARNQRDFPSHDDLLAAIQRDPGRSPDSI
jgi:peroxiredoxin